MSGSGDWGYGTIFKVFLWGYIIGGLSLLPAVIAFAWFWSTTPIDSERREPQIKDTGDPLDKSAKSDESAKDHDKDKNSLGLGLNDIILESLKSRTHEADVFAGYFAVCREYVPGGVNGKPLERTTPAGAVVAMESPSVYQSMYRSIFDRNKAANPSMDTANARNKKGRNVFYVVLRLGHLMLYDNDDQLEVRHVISLAHYQVDVYGGGEKIPEGELYIKRNCLRLIPKLAIDTTIDEAKSYYMFSDNCSDKEDFFHAMLQAQEHHQDIADRDPPPVPLKFETPDLVKLVQQLHASEENLHTRWINALIGRVFLALYKTPEIKNLIATKITKKIARVPKPALISSVQLKKIDMGTLPPFITNPKLKELTVDGDLVVEADVSYKGNFRLEIEAIARIDLGQRFKVREVTLVLASILKRLDGHILLRIKPPPSNRLWMTFETPPRIELSVEPIVSSRQITYGVVLRAIESRIREVVNETLVQPNWDDMPFTDTIAQAIRGGIWEGNSKGKEELEVKVEDTSGLDSATVELDKLDKLDDKAESIHSHLSVPSSLESVDENSVGVTSSTDWKSTPMKNRSLRSPSNTSTETLEPSSKSLPPTSPSVSPIRSFTEPVTESPNTSAEDISVPTLWSESSHSAPNLVLESGHSRSKSKEDLTPQQIATAAAAAASAQTTTAQPTKKQTINQSINSATNAARNWLAARQSQQEAANSARRNNSSPEHSSHTDTQLNNDGTADSSQHPSVSRSHTGPIGRGQPLPPPGTPLPPPRPEKRPTWGVTIPSASTFANLAKRKPVPPTPTASEHSVSQRPGSSASSNASTSQLTESLDEHGVGGVAPRRKSSAASSKEHPPPLPKRRQRQPSVNLQNAQKHEGSEEQTELFVVEAPVAEGSAPPSPGIQTLEGMGLGT